MSPANSHIVANAYNKTENPTEVKAYLMNWLSVSADNIIILILLLALAIKFIFFEDKGDIAKQLRFKEEDDTEEKVEIEYTELVDTAAMDVSLRQRFGESHPAMRSAIFPLSGVGGGWIEVENESQMEFIDKEVQTDGRQSSIDSSSSECASPQSTVPRPLEECLEIYKSEVDTFLISSKLVPRKICHLTFQDNPQIGPCIVRVANFSETVSHLYCQFSSQPIIHPPLYNFFPL